MLDISDSVIGGIERAWVWYYHVATYDTLWSSECAILLRTVIFADEYFRDGALSGGDRNTCMRNAWA